MEEIRYWPVWLPVPRRPWALQDGEGNYLRDDEGVALTFHDGQDAFKYAKKHKIALMSPPGGEEGQP